ncbi:DUF421 domain-containing protein [Hymenobacter chitinivorans]|uniref:Uncharacterized protein DUF421 n=1 Tax=Hymenobacter chitinivorans DSM 11115 TaxID=1121954 RepID=A0A2M9BTH7_9BACT|nr:YetF domain-containing protein [Hymenobacter chitinivorans]PJJ61254.1 uncharacterized protein DUF421 [Hymenobacter chitinivorans DSM 11115]
MKPEEIHITDYMRILLGQVPWSFLLEVAIRAVFLYALILVSMRLMGKRMSSQLSRHELAAIASIAAAVGVPIQAPDRGLLPALLIAAVIVLVQRFVFRESFRSRTFEITTQGYVDTMVEDGCLCYDAMQNAVLSQERLFAELRQKGIDNLGKVRRLYMEASGAITIVPQNPPRPGLTLIPSWDEDFLRDQHHAPDTYACCHCGNVQHAARQQQPAACTRCQHQEWSPAVVAA